MTQGSPSRGDEMSAQNTREPAHADEPPERVPGGPGRIDEERRLLGGALAGAPAARQRLVAWLTPTMRARARRLVARQRSGPLTLDLSDLCQIGWLALFEDDARRLRLWDPARGAGLKSYVGLVVHRVMVQALFRETAAWRWRAPDASPWVEQAPDTSRCDPERRTIARHTLRDVCHHLDRRLPTAGRTVLRAMADETDSVAEVATALGVSPNSAYLWRHRIRTRARQWRAAA